MGASLPSRHDQIRDAAQKDKHRRRREGILILVLALLAGSLLYLVLHISRVAESSSFIQPFIVYFFNFAVWALILVLILTLVFLIVRNVVKFLFERRKGVLGARIRMRLIVAFMALSLGPATVLFLLSIYILNTSIERLYDPHILNVVESAKQVISSADRISKFSRQVMSAKYDADGEATLHFAEEIARAFLERGWLNLLSAEGLGRRPTPPEDALAGCPVFPDDTVSSLRPTPVEQLADFITAKREEYSVAVVAVFDEQSRCVVKSQTKGRLPELPPADVKKALGGEQGYNPPLSVGASEAVLYAFYPIPRRGGSTPPQLAGVVAVGRKVSWIPEEEWKNLEIAEEAKATLQDYETLHQLELPLKFSYVLLIVFVTLIVIFLAVWFGFFVAKGITEPIQLLAEGTEMVASGNLDYRIELAAEGDDEISTLVRSFNKMTLDLSRSQAELKAIHRSLAEKNLELEQRRRYMETVLGHVAAGVISLDPDNRISTINAAARRMLGREDEVLSRPLDEVVPAEEMELFQSLLSEMESEDKENAQRQFTMVRDNRSYHILLTVSRLRDEKNLHLGTVIVIDDLTELIRAHRAMAWREVARRIAHEIKNPLTPIQLAAQRLSKRYADQLAGEDAQIFADCTRTIVRQVEELKHLVNEFSYFARLPSTQPIPSDLHQIIQEVLPLYREAHPHISFQFLPDERLPTLELDREQIKRVFLNLLDNAVASIKEEGEVTIETGFFDKLQIVRIELRDTGEGIPPHLRERIFEPYYSTKPEGTGLGMAIVQRIISDHFGYIRVVDNIPRGTKIIIELPVLQTEKDRGRTVSSPAASSAD